MAIDAGAVVLPVEPGAVGFAKDLARQIAGQSRQFTSVGRDLGAKIGAGMGPAVGGDQIGGKLARDVASQSGKMGAAGKELGEKLGGGIEDALEDVHARVGTRMGPGFVSLGGKLGGAVLGGFAALGVGSLIAGEIGKGLDIEAANDKLGAQLGLTAKQSERAGRLAGDLYAGAWGDSIDQVNDAFKGIQTNIGDLSQFSNRQLKSMGKSALDLATILDEDVGRTTRAAGQLMRNDLAPNAKAAFDIITRATQEGGNSAGDLLDTIEEYSPSFAALGLSGPQALGAISASLKAGARNGDLAADAIKEFSIRAIDGSELSAQGFRKLGLDASDMAAAIGSGGPKAQKAFSTVLTELGKIRDPVKQEAAGVALFGTQFEDLGIKAILALDPMESKLDKVGGASDRMGKALNDNAKTNIESFKRQLSRTATDVIGNTLLPALSDLTADLNDDLKPAIRTTKEVWKDFSGVIGPDTRKISDAVAEHLGVEVPDDLNRSGNAFGRYADRIDEARKDGIRSFRGLRNTLSSETLSWGEKFGIIWSDIWAENTRSEQRNLDRMTAIGDTFQAAQRGDWRTFGVALNTITGDAFTRMREGVATRLKKFAADTSVRLFVLKLMWSNAAENIRDAVTRRFGDMINWVIRNVWNRGIRRVWNAIAGRIGFRDLPEVDQVAGRFAAGGRVPGSGRGDRVLILAEPGEFVVNREATGRNLGLLETINEKRQPDTDPLLQGFQRGGLVALGRWFQSKGARVSEHPSFGGVNPVHTPGSYHYSGDAIDVNYGPAGQNATEMRFFDRWIPVVRALGEYKEILWRVAGHFNHAHIGGYTKGGGVLSRIGGFLTSLWESIKNSVTGPISRIREQISGFMQRNPFAGLLGGMSRKLVSGVFDKIKDTAKSLFTGGGGAGAASGPVAQVVRTVARTFGWGDGPQWEAIKWIISKESGWRPTAQNPTSTAYGLFQFLNSTWAGTGIGKTSDPRLQTIAGLRYVRSRYRLPTNAVSFHRSHGWYDSGGWLPPGVSTAVNNTGRYERVLSPQELQGGLEPLDRLASLDGARLTATFETGDGMTLDGYLTLRQQEQARWTRHHVRAGGR